MAIDVDSPPQHSAMVEKLSLPFPMLSDPDRDGAIRPFGVADEKDPRNIARPAVIVVTPAGGEVFRFIGRDFADRIHENDVVAAVRALGLPATTQPVPETLDPQPGRKAMPFEGLAHYYRGARFAAQAMGLRHAHFDESIKEDSKAYVAEMDRYIEAVRSLAERRGGWAPSGGHAASRGDGGRSG